MKLSHNAIATVFAVLATLLSASSAAQSAPPALKPGDPMPPLVGQALTGTSIDLPAAAAEAPAAVILSFSRAGGRDAEAWAQHLSKDHPHLAIYTVIFLESVPRLFLDPPPSPAYAAASPCPCKTEPCSSTATRASGNRDCRSPPQTRPLSSC
jgi:hypothetical protein